MSFSIRDSIWLCLNDSDFPNHLDVFCPDNCYEQNCCIRYLTVCGFVLYCSFFFFFIPYLLGSQSVLGRGFCLTLVDHNVPQCSCLENPRDGGAWWVAVYGVAKSQTWLKWLSSSSSRRSQDNWKIYHKWPSALVTQFYFLF